MQNASLFVNTLYPVLYAPFRCGATGGAAQGGMFLPGSCPLIHLMVMFMNFADVHGVTLEGRCG